MTRVLPLALALAGCTSPAPALECRHGEVSGSWTLHARRADVVVAIDGASLSLDAAPSIAARTRALVASIVEMRELDELTVGVLETGRGPELGRFTAPPDCDGTGGRLSWSRELDAPIDGVLDVLACRVASAATDDASWQPAEALADLFESSFRRDGALLYVVLVTAGDAPNPDYLARTLESAGGRASEVWLVAGYPADDAASETAPIDPPGGCTSPDVTADPAPALHAVATRLARLGVARVASICAPSWDRVWAPPHLTTTTEPAGCLPRRPLLDALGHPACEVTETLPDDGFLPRCDALPGRELVEPDGDPRHCRWRMITDAEAAAGARGAYLSDDVSECVARRPARLVFTDDFAAGAEVRLACRTELSDTSPCE